MARKKLSPQRGPNEAALTSETRQDTIRTTRSQARSASIDPPPQTLPRTTRSAARQETVVSDAGMPSGPRRNVRRDDVARAATPLEPVEEDRESDPINDDRSSYDEAAEAEGLMAVDDPMSQDQVLHNQASESSAPFEATHSQTELEILDRDAIIGTLADLESQSRRLLRLLVRENASEEDLGRNLEQLYDPKSKISSDLKIRMKAFNSTQDGTFGSQTYTRPDIILRCLLNVQDVTLLPDRAWRPDAIIYMGNLAKLVHQLCQITPEDARILPMLNSLDVTFPQAFSNEFPSDTSFQETFGMAMELRTQFAIMNVIEQRPQTYDEASGHIFSVFVDTYDSEDALDSLALELKPRLWDGLPVNQFSIVGSIAQRVQELRRPFKHIDGGLEDATQAIMELQSNFPWIELQLKLLRWAQMRMDEIDQDLDDRGGTAAVINALEQEISRRTSNPDVSEDERDDGGSANDGSESGFQRRSGPLQRPATTSALTGNIVASSNRDSMSSSKLGTKTWSKGGMSFLKQNRSTAPRQTSETTENIPNRSDAGPISGLSRHTPVLAKEDEYRDIDDIISNDERDLPTQARLLPPTQRHADPPMSPMKRKMGEILRNNKENRSAIQQKKSLLDSQDGAQRVEWDEVASQERDEAPTRFRQPTHLQPPAQGTASSSRDDNLPTYIEDPSEDEGFETDLRHPTTKRPRVEPQNTQPTSTRRSHRPLFVEPAPMPAWARVSDTPRRNPGQLIEPYVAPTARNGAGTAELTIADQIHQSNHLARAGRVQQVSRKPARARNRWSDIEVECLITLMGEHGISWALLKAIDRDNEGILADRTQVDLKDKARNLVLDCIKAGQPPFRNYALVPIDKKGKDALEARGISYEDWRIKTLAQEAEDDVAE